jgi:MoCo/4Fe-4S cofactor protein with predicted Tat translocation signal
MTKKDEILDFAAFSSRVEKNGQRDFWRSLEELEGDEKFQELLATEFPYMAGHDRTMEESGVDRRQFLKFMGASMAFAGLTACRPPSESIVPYVQKPEEIVPGIPLFFATAMPLGSAAIGLLVESHEGRPTKVEGNPLHPASLGATNAWAQASLLSLYDPDRSSTLRYLGEVSSWGRFTTALQAQIAGGRAGDGSRVRLLTETIVSPTLGEQLRTFLAQNPGAIWHQYDPVNQDNELEGARLALGTYAAPLYRFDNADVILSLDSDVLGAGAGSLRYLREFSARRRVRLGQTTMNRLYAIESSPTMTGSLADHKIPVKPSQIAMIAQAFGAALGAGGQVADDLPLPRPWFDAVVRDLQRHRGRSLVVAGEGQHPAVHALAHAMNTVLGNMGSTVLFTDPASENPMNQTASLRQLAADMAAGNVDTLIMLGGNPVFNAPGDLGFAAAMDRVAFRAHLSPYYDETSVRSHWHVPMTHFIESWSDARAFDGTVSIIQPLIAPLFNGRSIHEVASVMIGEELTPYDRVRQFWSTRMPGGLEQGWNRALHDGVIAGSAAPPRVMNATAAGVALTNQMVDQLQRVSGIEISFRHDPAIHDGRFANNGWLQELPKPLTKVSWDNVAHISPAMAEQLGVRNEDRIEIVHEGRAVTMPAWIQPGHPSEVVTLHFGYGRTRGGRVANGTGFNVYPLRSSMNQDWVAGAEVTRAGGKYPVACTQTHHSMEGRALVRAGTVSDFVANPEFAKEHADYIHGMNLLHGWEYRSYAWAMTIDTSACIGCGGCIIACNAENNIPVVGKKEVRRGREMHWLRIDRYYEGSPANPITFHQPILCMHCENAPCEPVCPVEATTHSPEGINEMTYNRCIGTRYCSNNCPYKVRRFNFFQYADFETPSYKLMRNPNVTTRSRGVMEKCTFCVQRVNRARIASEKAGRRIEDGEVITACQAACPAEAIVFGDQNNPNSRVAAEKAQPTSYGLLAEVNTQPRVSYLATIRNPNPEIKAV